MKEKERFGEPKRIDEIIDLKKLTGIPKMPDVEKTVAKIQEEKLFIELWNKSTKDQKLAVIHTQLTGITKTIDTVSLIGRIKIKDDKETFFYMVDRFYESYGLDMGRAIIDAKDLIVEYGEMTLQDMELFFKKFRFGLYGKLYGKLNFALMMQYFDNFQRSVGYNLSMERDKTHRELKDIERHRDLHEWYDNNKPEEIE